MGGGEGGGRGGEEGGGGKVERDGGGRRGADLVLPSFVQVLATDAPTLTSRYNPSGSESNITTTLIPTSGSAGLADVGLHWWTEHWSSTSSTGILFL